MSQPISIRLNNDAVAGLESHVQLGYGLSKAWAINRAVDVYLALVDANDGRLLNTREIERARAALLEDRQ